MHDATDPHLAASPGHGPGEQGRAGGQEAAVADLRAVDMSMRADQDVIADDNGVAGPAADHRVLYHDAPGSQGYLAILGRPSLRISP